MIEGHVVSSIKEHVGWSEKLASFSEAAIKADQSMDRPFADLQQMTVQYLQETDYLEPPVIAAGTNHNIAGTTFDDIDDFEDETKDYYEQLVR